MEAQEKNRAEAERWLYAYSEQEEWLRAYFRENGRLFAGENGATRRHNQTLTDAMFIDRHTDVAIVKHPRYQALFDHSHTFFEISYVVGGACRHTVHVSGAEEEIVLRTGDVLILPPSVVHRIQVDDESIVANILMRRRTFDSAFLRGIPSDSVLSTFFTDILYSDTHANFLLIHTGDSARVRGAFFDILEEYLGGGVYAAEIINQLLGLFFLYILREGGSRVQISSKYRREARCVPAVIHYMEMHYATTSVHDLARDFGYDISHLCKLYKKYTGATLRETLGQIRMRHACELLVKSSWGVDDVALMVGYRDVSSFIRRFRREFGVTPLQYRKGNHAPKLG